MDRLCENSATTCDLLIIGGGINGVGIARDAAGRGLRVLLCEMGDLGGATSSASSKLIHGGLRYLEYGEFRLVREALAEREVLLRIAPHIIWPLRFRLPHRPQLRPAWLIRLGLFLYDHLSRRNTLRGSCSLQLDSNSPLRHQFQQAFEYSDGWVDDARLVILNALSAHQLGADIRPRTRCTRLSRVGNHWQALLVGDEGQPQPVQASMVVNAAGPWVTELYSQVLQQPPPAQVRLVRGSHIVIPRLHQGPEGWILQTDDRRIVFVLPFENDFSLIGTTDIEHQSSLSEVSVSDDEKSYLIDVCNQHFRQQSALSDIVHSFAGVRPLLDDQAQSARAVTRDYRLELDAAPGQPPLLSIFGGKITTYRKLAESALELITQQLPVQRGRWTATLPLPGGDFATRAELAEQLRTRWHWLPEQLLQRYVRSYGTLCQQFLADCDSLESLGEHFGAGLYAAEVRYLCQREWAFSSEDILWRRSKLGLQLSPLQQQALQQWLTAEVH